MESINGSEWVWNIVNTYDSEVRNISDRLSFEKMLLWVNTRGMVMNKEIRSDKRIKNIIGIIQSCLILILIFLIVFMIIQINRLQGTARNFDLAVSQTMHPEIFEQISSEAEGMKLVKSTMKYLCSIGKPYLIFELGIQCVGKYAGYRLGKRYKKLSRKQILKCTMSPEYWKRLWNQEVSDGNR